jgi:hypothetical protein
LKELFNRACSSRTVILEAIRLIVSDLHDYLKSTNTRVPVPTASKHQAHTPQHPLSHPAARKQLPRLKRTRPPHTLFAINLQQPFIATSPGNIPYERIDPLTYLLSVFLVTLHKRQILVPQNYLGAQTTQDLWIELDFQDPDFRVRAQVRKPRALALRCCILRGEFECEFKREVSGTANGRLGQEVRRGQVRFAAQILAEEPASRVRDGVA